MKIRVWYVLDEVDFELVCFTPVGEEVACPGTFAAPTPAGRFVRFAGAFEVDF
jgi:hypothetical protein